jgi:L,D-transpeptidase catalytic domain
MKYMKFLVLLLVALIMSLPFLVVAQESSAFATNTPVGQNNLPFGGTSTPLAQLPTATSTATPLAPPTVLSSPNECIYVAGQATSEACIDFMNANPVPIVDDIRLDVTTLNQYSFWRVGPEAVATYSEPGGAPTGQIAEGFNFVNVVNQIDGWIQTEDDRWISTNNAYSVETSRFTGVMLPEDWTLPFGWILDTTGIYASSVPGGKSDPETGLVPRHYQRFNIFAEVRDAEGWLWYLVGPNQWVKQVFMTVIKPVERPAEVSGRWAAVDLFEQSLVAYDGNTPVYATLISSGLPGSETDEGVFEVWARLERDGMSGAFGAPTAYELQSVPWVQYFDGDNALHGTYWHDTFGYRRSRGCVNMSISDASWIYEFFNPIVESGRPAYVYVYSSGDYRS